MINFFNSFLSYLLLFLCFAGIAGVGVFVGITMRKRKNQALDAQAKQESEAVEEPEA